MTAASPPRLQALTRLKGDLYRIEVRAGRKTLQATLRLDGSVPPASEWTYADLERIVSPDVAEFSREELAILRVYAWRLDGAVAEYAAPRTDWVPLHHGGGRSVTLTVCAASPVYIKVCANEGIGDDDEPFANGCLYAADVRPILQELLAKALPGVDGVAALAPLQAALEQGNCKVTRA